MSVGFMVGPILAPDRARPPLRADRQQQTGSDCRSSLQAMSLDAADPAAARSAEQALLGLEHRPRWRRAAGWVVVALLPVALAAAAWWWQQRSRADDAPRYVTEPVTRGDLALRVSANGTLAATRTVNVGSELSGTVARVLVDINDVVKRGQLLAELRDQVARSQAALESAGARVAQARATLTEAAGKLERQHGIERLSDGMFPAKADLDAAQAAFDRAVADEAAARAGVNDARAAARVDATNLAKASIRAPADGVVLVRNVDPGNAVAASLQAVTLFTIAEDLTRMKLQVNIDEADVGQVRDGQRATFTVSAYPNREWPATIRRVGYGSTIKDNVVTYVAELEVANPDRALRPGMTAVATIAATERKGVLLVPNAALRFTPAAAGARPAEAQGGSIVSRLVPRPPQTGGPRRAGTNAAAARQVHVLRDGTPVAVPVQPGLSNGRVTEITETAGGVLREGDAVIVERVARAP
jgi:HlyD family secretion protein